MQSQQYIVTQLFKAMTSKNLDLEAHQLTHLAKGEKRETRKEDNVGDFPFQK